MSKGPLAVRFGAFPEVSPQAGALERVQLRVENAGTVAWRPPLGIGISYHWLDRRGNPIVWDGLRHEVAAAPSERIECSLGVRGPIPPGRYRLAFDLVDEHRFWLAELGNVPLELDVDVAPRDAQTARPFLPAETEPGPEWEEQMRAAHAEGYAAVGGSIEWHGGPLRRRPAELGPYAPGGGRNPAFAHPLVCPSLLPPLEPNTEVAGLPAWRPEGDEPWLYDARIVLRPLTLRPQSGRRRG